MLKTRVHIYSSEEYKRHKEKYLERQRRYRNNPLKKKARLERAKLKSREWYSNPENRARRYKYNQKWWQNKIEEMEEIMGRKRPVNCEICGKEGVIVFDHCHKTDKPRGWICVRCNITLGKVEDNINLLEKLIIYLKKNQ
jgi:hypothetical protein